MFEGFPLGLQNRQGRPDGVDPVLGRGQDDEEAQII